jgi:hypothetical protein
MEMVKLWACGPSAQDAEQHRGHKATAVRNGGRQTIAFLPEIGGQSWEAADSKVEMMTEQELQEGKDPNS